VLHHPLSAGCTVVSPQRGLAGVCAQALDIVTQRGYCRRATGAHCRRYIGQSVVSTAASTVPNWHLWTARVCAALASRHRGSSGTANPTFDARPAGDNNLNRPGKVRRAMVLGRPRLNGQPGDIGVIPTGLGARRAAEDDRHTRLPHAPQCRPVCVRASDDSERPIPSRQARGRPPPHAGWPGTTPLGRGRVS
jgi:hypothetical protein